jgi:CHAT domain-containing protein
MSDAGNPQAFWERHLLGIRAWISAGFGDHPGARDAALALEEWLGRYPCQASRVMQIALSSAFTAWIAAAHGVAKAFASVAVDASAFRALSDSNELAAAALAASILSEANFENGNATDAGAALRYARSLVESIDEGGALSAWAAARCDLLDATMAESVLERRQAEALYRSAYETAEPLVRNARLATELRRDWLEVVYGNAQHPSGQENAGEDLVNNLVSGLFVQAALGQARAATEGSQPDVFTAAADACIEFGVPRETSAVELHAALERLAGDARLRAIDALVSRCKAQDNRKSKAIVAMLLGLRANTNTNPNALEDLERAGEAAAKAADALAWTTLLADMIDHTARAGGDITDRVGMFLMVHHSAERGVRGTPRHLPFRLHFERTLTLATADALERYEAAPTEEARTYLSSCLEFSRDPMARPNIRPEDHAPERLERASTAASDWLGRIAYAVKCRPDVLILIPVSTPSGTTLICIAEGTEGDLEAYATSADYEAAVGSLSTSMRASFTPEGGGGDIAVLGRAAFAALPSGVKKFLRKKRTVLLVPDAATERAAIPYELFQDGRNFLGITDIFARMPSLRAVARVLEPATVSSPAATRRALCVAAPNTIPTQPLQFAQSEVDTVRASLAAALWNVPALESQISPRTLLSGCEFGSLVHIAAHGEVAAGAHAILLPDRQRLGVDTITAHRGELPALVYLSVCSVGASEYLGGGVSRGIAAALIEKGAPAVIASQLPLEDAMAAKFALTFCEAALHDTVGGALRTARASMLQAVPPVLWSSLILIGDPWHRLDAEQASRSDAATRLLGVTVDARKDAKARTAALASASKAGKRVKDPRLTAAVAWADEAGALFDDPQRRGDAQWAEQMAEIAGDLGSPVGELLFRIAESDLHQAGGDIEARVAALDRAIDIGQRVVRHDPKWGNTLQALLAARQQADLRVEIPEITTAAGLRVNDRRDPAVRAILEMQHAVDQQQVRMSGELRAYLPDGSLADLCWNAIVLGQRNRFADEFACAAFASQIVGRATRAGWLDSGMEADARRVAGGMLHFLWTSQRITHLERERAVGQSGTLRVALEDLSAEGADAGTAEGRESLLKRGGQLVAQEPSSGSRFARVRERLRDAGAGANEKTLSRLATEFIDDSPAQSRMRAHRAGWASGYLLELAYELRLSGRAGMADNVLSEYAMIERNAEANLAAYLFEGFKSVSEAPLDPLMAWRYPRPAGDKPSAETPPRGSPEPVRERPGPSARN